MAYTISFVSLGCAKNQVNCEQMMALCAAAGHTLVGPEDPCDVCVINTCGFIDSAKEEAIAAILDAAARKAAGQVGKILVTGCLSQRYRRELPEELPASWAPAATGRSRRRWTRRWPGAAPGASAISTPRWRRGTGC